MRNSALALAWNALKGNRSWTPVWRDAAPRDHYDVLIIGGGGHGLAAAYYLARNHGISNVAVLEKNWIGSGNAGRNTTIIRSNYLMPGNIPFYELSMKLWEGLEQDLNYNTMVSQRGVLNLYHSDAQRDAFARRGNAMRLHGVDAELLDRAQTADLVPYLDFDDARFPIQGGLLQRRGGTARHDAVVWGYARAADQRGVDIVQNCEVTGIQTKAGRIVAVETSRGAIRADKIAVSVAGNSSRLAAMAGLRLPIESHVLQAFVTEGIKPLVDHVITFGAGHFYISQSDKGGLVFGGDIDGYNSYAQRGNLAYRRGRLRRRHGDHALAWTAANCAFMGRPRGYVDGRFPDHRSDIHRRFVPQRWLVLRRIQSDPGSRMVLWRIWSRAMSRIHLRWRIAWTVTPRVA